MLEAARVGLHRAVHLIVGVGGDANRQLALEGLRPGGRQREHLQIDAGRVHRRDARRADVVQLLLHVVPEVLAAIPVPFAQQLVGRHLFVVERGFEVIFQCDDSHVADYPPGLGRIAFSKRPSGEEPARAGMLPAWQCSTEPRVAIHATDGVEQVELTEPRKALDAAGATTTLVSLKAGAIQGMHHHEKGDQIPVDRTLDDVQAGDFDALLLPGGVANPDTLRTDAHAVAFVRAFADAGKPIAAICHGPWMLVEADVVRDKRVTSWPSLKTDLRNAGANWADEPNVVDGNLTTSRNPDDIPLFNKHMIAVFAGGERPAGV